MRKLPRHITARVDRETADAFHKVMASRGQTASAFIRAAICGVLAAKGRAAPGSDLRGAA